MAGHGQGSVVRPRGTGRAGRRLMTIFATSAMVALSAGAGAPAARADDEQAEDLWAALTQGKPVVDVRGRIEIAEAEPLNRSEDYSVRTRIGYGTRPFHGVRVYMDMENIAAASESSYFDPTRPPNVNMLTPIADPPGTEVNQGFLEIDRPDWLGSQLIGGRQRIVFDDQRFVGDIAWRQNMQTFDALYFQTSAGVTDLTARYAFIGFVNRIFGGGGSVPALADFDSRSHTVNVSFTKLRQARLVGFAYLLDLLLPRTAAPGANSSKSFGGRLTGEFGLGDAFQLQYQGSYAYQSQYGAKTTVYSANYGLVDAGLTWKGVGTAGGGFELLGSDAGRQQFLTPLATAHKFNGWADVFLDNGGPGGLRDFYAYLAPTLPWKLRMRLVYHRFWSDATGAVLGNEFDGLIGRPIGKFVDLQFKSAYFVAADGSPRPTTYRVWLDLTFKF